MSSPTNSPPTTSVTLTVTPQEGEKHESETLQESMPREEHMSVPKSPEESPEEGAQEASQKSTQESASESPQENGQESTEEKGKKGVNARTQSCCAAPQYLEC